MFIRRALLALLVSITAYAAEPAEVVPAPDLPYEIRELAPGLWAALQPDALRFNDSNSLIVETDRDVLVIDSQSDPAKVELLAAEIRRRCDRPVRFVVNTHWHGDHTQGNAVYEKVFGNVIFLAHGTWWDDVRGRGLPQLHEELDATRTAIERAAERLAKGQTEEGEAMSDEEKTDLAGRIERTQDRVTRLAAIRIPPPTVAFEDRLTLHLTWQGKPRPVHLLHLRGHTRGDVVVHLPSERLLATGDLLDALPFGGHGYPSEWIAALDELATLGFDRVVPGHGAVQEGAGHLRLVRKLFAEIVRQAEAAVKAGAELEPARDQAMESAPLRALRERLAGEDALANRVFDGFVPSTFERAFLEASGTLPD